MAVAMINVITAGGILSFKSIHNSVNGKYIYAQRLNPISLLRICKLMHEMFKDEPFWAGRSPFKNSYLLIFRCGGKVLFDSPDAAVAGRNIHNRD